MVYIGVRYLAFLLSLSTALFSVDYLDMRNEVTGIYVH